MPTLTRKDVTLHYELTGQGTPILMIQGVGVIGNGWKPQVDTLSKQRQTLIFDNRGLGKSIPCQGEISIPAMAEDALALMDAVGWEKAHVVGHSMGGVIAQCLALDHPKRVLSLSLLCTFTRGREVLRLSPTIIWKGLLSKVGPRDSRRRAMLGLIMSRDYMKDVNVVLAAERIAPLFGHDPANQDPLSGKQLKAMLKYDRSEELSNLGTIPTLVVSGEEDPIALPAYGRRLGEVIPGAHYHELRGLSHGLPIEAPSRINTLLEAFFGVCDAG